MDNPEDARAMNNPEDFRAFIAEEVFEADHVEFYDGDKIYYGLRVGVNNPEDTGESLEYVFIFHDDEDLLRHIARKVNMSFDPEGVDLNKELSDYNKWKESDG